MIKTLSSIKNNPARPKGVAGGVNYQYFSKIKNFVNIQLMFMDILNYESGILNHELWIIDLDFLIKPLMILLTFML